MKHFIQLKDFSRSELIDLLNLAVQIKKEQKQNQIVQRLHGKNLAMIFQKPSNRTRVSFEVGMNQLGGQIGRAHV